MAADIIITLGLVAGAVLIIAHLGRMLRTFALQRTIREAIKADSGATPALLDRIDDMKGEGPGDDRIAAVLLALGAALVCYGLLQEEPDVMRGLAGMGLFPGFVGAALLIRLWIVRRLGGRG